MEERAFAKINLALHVRAREADGYHRIETLFAFAEDGDRLTVEPADRLALELTGPFAAALGDPADNLVLRAARSLQERCGITEGAALTLDKVLPVASGIGGGSADAAATLRLLKRFWSLTLEEDDLLEVARGLGADVPACLLSRPLWGEGKGDRLIPADLPSGQPLLLVNPGVPVGTAEVFRAWDGIDRGSLAREASPAAIAAARNDLEAPAVAIAPVIGEVLAGLRSLAGAGLVRMSGSGATCFALFETEEARDRASGTIASARPGWWRLATRLR